jgi:hypothetical protein
MKHYCPTCRRKHGTPLKRLLDTWERNGSTSGLTPRYMLMMMMIMMMILIWFQIVQGKSCWMYLEFYIPFGNLRGLESSVGIATELRTGRSGIESRWGRDFPPVQTGPGAGPPFCKMGTGSFPRAKCGRGVLLTTQPLLVPRSWKSKAIPLPTLWTTSGL